MPRNPVSAPARTLLAVLVAASLALPAAAAGEPPGPRPTADAGGTAARELPPLPGPPPSAVPADDDPARIAVKPASGVGDKALSAEVARLGGRVGRTLPRIGWTAVEVPPGRAREVAARLRARGVVSEAAPDRRVHLAHVPDDPLFPEQWSLRNTGQRDGTAGADIGAPEAWDIHTGSSDVVVAVCDTGVDLTHPDLAANAWTNPGEIPGNGIDDDGNGLIDDVNGWDWYNGDETVYDPSDGDSHGTHVAGTIGAVGGNGIGVAGVSHDVSMMALKFIGPHGGSLIDAAEAVVYATDHGARVINHSWASLGAEPYFDDALAYSAARGVLNVAAAGNRAVSLEGVDFFPASSEATNVIAVASSTRYDTLSYFSNWGSTKVHLAAPGSEITSTVPGSYGSKSGTSMAAPHVTGAAALAMAARPGASAAEVRSRLLDTVDRSAWLRGWVASDGRLDAAAALAEEFAAAPSGVVTVTPQAFEAGRVGEVVWGPAPWTAAGTAYEIQAGVRSLALDEGFETGLDGWGTGGDAPFHRSSAGGDAHSGSWGVRSGVLGATGASFIERTVVVPEGGARLAFWFRLDLEGHYDWAYMTVDGFLWWWATQDYAWTFAEIPLPEGARTLRWVYSKEGSEGQGDGAFGLDDVTLAVETWDGSVTAPAGSTSATFTIPATFSDDAFVRVRGTFAGRVSGWAGVRGLRIAEPTPPRPPSGLSAVPGDNAADLSWDQPSDPDVFEWEVRRAQGGGEFAEVARVRARRFEDRGLTNGDTYRYRVVAIDGLGLRSAESSEVAVVPEDVERPAAPTGLTARPGHEEVCLAWDPAPEEDFDHWEVLRAIENGGYSLLATPSVPSCEDTPLQPGVLYHYHVIAVDDDGLRSIPSTISVEALDLEPPAPPTGLTADPSPGRVSLSWSAGSEPDIRDWEVWRAKGTGSFARIAVVPSPSFVDDAVDNGVTYGYRVLARDTADNPSGFSEIVSATPLAAVARLAGGDRYATALAVSRASFAAADTVVLATGAAFPDALSASALAGAHRAPLLLTPRDKLPSGLSRELQRLGARNVIIVGGEAAVSLAVERALSGSYMVTRVHGSDRYATSAAVAKRVKALGGGERVFVARGDSFPDALSASPMAYSRRYPVLLVRTDAIPPVTAAALRSVAPLEAIVLGSRDAIGEPVRSALGVKSERWGGADRYATSALVATRGTGRGWATFGAVGVATGVEFPDALGGGAALGSRSGVLLLTARDTLPSAVSSAVSLNKPDIDDLYVIGGPPAVSREVEDGIRALLGL